MTSTGNLTDLNKVIMPVWAFFGLALVVMFGAGFLYFDSAIPSWLESGLLPTLAGVPALFYARRTCANQSPFTVVDALATGLLWALVPGLLAFTYGINIVWTWVLSVMAVILAIMPLFYTRRIRS